jgi:hypothetical protein
MMYSKSHDNSTKIKDPIERNRYRRWSDAFGIKAISDAVRRYSFLNRKLANDEDSLAIFEVHPENIEYALSIFSGELNTHFVDVCGDVLEQLEDLKSGRDIVLPDAPAFDKNADREQWMPSPEDLKALEEARKVAGS